MLDTRRELAVTLVLFTATAAMATVQRWSTTDLVWSLWISSLVVGYSLILTSILGALIHGTPETMLAVKSRQIAVPSPRAEGPPGQPPAVRTAPGLQVLPLNLFIFIGYVWLRGWSGTPWWLIVMLLASTMLAAGGVLRTRLGLRFVPNPEHGLAKVVVMLPVALFMFAFFTVHFLGFHIVDGLFLNGFFPLSENMPVGKDLDSIFAFMRGVAGVAMTRYWSVVLASALSRLAIYAKAFETTDGAMMVVPYLNVIRMHVMIFVLAFLGMAGLRSVALYAVLILYFLPIGRLVQRARNRHAGQGATEGEAQWPD